jgi:hypothetical protein
MKSLLPQCRRLCTRQVPILEHHDRMTGAACSVAGRPDQIDRRCGVCCRRDCRRLLGQVRNGLNSALTLNGK